MSALHVGLLQLGQTHLDRIERARAELVQSQVKGCEPLDRLLLEPLHQQLRGATSPAARRRLQGAMFELSTQLTWRLHRGLLEQLQAQLERSRRLAITVEVCRDEPGFLAALEGLGEQLAAELAGPPELACGRLLARLGLLSACDELLDEAPEPQDRFRAALVVDRARALDRHSLAEFARLTRLLDRHLGTA
jgi:hypothetical protein